MTCIKIEENSIFKLCSGLIDDWKEEVEKSAASGLSDTHTGEQCKMDLEAKIITSLIKTFKGLNAIEKDCADTRLNSKLSNLLSKVKNKIECDIATYCQKKELEHDLDRVKNRYLADLNWEVYS